MWWIIFGIIGIIAIGMVLFMVGFSKQKEGDILVVYEDKDYVQLLLSDDDYMKIDISDIKNDITKINTKIKDVVSSRAYELKNLITKVTIFHRDDKAFEEKLLSVINAT